MDEKLAIFLGTTRTAWRNDRRSESSSASEQLHASTHEWQNEPSSSRKTPGAPNLEFCSQYNSGVAHMSFEFVQRRLAIQNRRQLD